MKCNQFTFVDANFKTLKQPIGITDHIWYLERRVKHNHALGINKREKRSDTNSIEKFQMNIYSHE